MFIEVNQNGVLMEINVDAILCVRSKDTTPSGKALVFVAGSVKPLPITITYQDFTAKLRPWISK